MLLRSGDDRQNGKAREEKGTPGSGKQGQRHDLLICLCHIKFISPCGFKVAFLKAMHL